jgi:hypothetical protein
MGISMNMVKRNEATDVFASGVALYQTKPNWLKIQTYILILTLKNKNSFSNNQLSIKMKSPAEPF